jgi:hypothetical protein
MADLIELAERVEKGEGPDAKLDRAIFDLCLGGRFWEEENGAFFTREYRGQATPVSFTSSLDAVVALLERVLPGWGHGYATGWYGKDMPGGFVFPPNSGADLLKATLGKGSSPARALLAAILRALSEKDR